MTVFSITASSVVSKSIAVRKLLCAMDFCWGGVFGVIALEDSRELTLQLLGRQYGPAAAVLIDDALFRAQMDASDLRSSNNYLKFLRVLERELPGDEISNRATVTRLWNAMADHFLHG